VIKEDAEFIPTRHSLLSRLKDWDDQESWRDFFNTYWKLIYSAAIKAGLSDAEAQDVVQETIVTVTKKIKDLKYDPALGSFKGWLRTVTRSRIVDHYRKRPPQKRSADHSQDTNQRTATVDRLPDPASLDLDQVWETEWQKNLMDAALARVKRQVNPKHYQIFDLHVVRGMPVEQVTTILGVSRAQVYMAKQRISRELKKNVQYLESKFI